MSAFWKKFYRRFKIEEIWGKLKVWILDKLVDFVLRCSLCPEKVEFKVQYSSNLKKLEVER